MRTPMILLVVVLCAVEAKVDCSIHEIYWHIKRLNPSMNSREAMKHSNTIYRAAEYYNLNPRHMVAIIQQESSWDDSVAVVVHRNGSIDLGLAQINQRTAQAYGLDVGRLIAEPSYSIWAQAKILKRKIRTCLMKGLKHDRAWSCYHSYTRQHRAKYEKLVRRWM